MNEIDSDPLAYYCSINPSQFSVLKSLTLEQEVGAKGEMQQVVTIVLARDVTYAGTQLYLRFSGVRNLTMSQPSLSLISIPFLEITLNDQSTLDGAYVVRDGEQTEMLAFTCNEIVVALVQ